ncbi:unnamed protein product [Paramecium octaurelia]|uniref:Uncharacterized protein n=1 Tax=Paramecium octaurelia TaxID=43137 RepID=A0A8S1WQP7_PAROT|nr:unnamed protein product [Paramecium octaurelia]
MLSCLQCPANLNHLSGCRFQLFNRMDQSNSQTCDKQRYTSYDSVQFFQNNQLLCFEDQFRYFVNSNSQY